MGIRKTGAVTGRVTGVRENEVPWGTEEEGRVVTASLPGWQDDDEAALELENEAADGG
jgi:hypothetical protein